MNTMLKMYGIPNCDTVKKARTWLQTQGVAFEFHDFKKQGITPELLASWLQHPQPPGWETLLNRRGTTWRGLPPDLQASVLDAATAIDVMQAHPSVIKRPVMVWPHAVTVGFNPDEWAAHLARSLP